MSFLFPSFRTIEELGIDKSVLSGKFCYLFIDISTLSWKCYYIMTFSIMIAMIRYHSPQNIVSTL